MLGLALRSAFVCEGVNDFEVRWIGWAGVNVPDEVEQRALSSALAEKVFLLHKFFFDL